MAPLQQDTQPQFTVYTSAPPNYVPPHPPAPFHRLWQGKKFLFILFSFTLVFLLGGGLFVYAYAYYHITLGSPAAQHKVSFFVQNLPFTPTTPSFVIAKNLQAQNTVSKARFDAVLTLSLPNRNLFLFGSTFNFRSKGYADFSNPRSPSFDVTMHLNRDFDIAMKLHESRLYFRVNKLPFYFTKFFASYFALFGIH